MNENTQTSQPTIAPTPPVSPVYPISKSKNHTVVWIAAGAVILTIGIGIGLMLGKYLPKQIASYEDCIKVKGSSVQESNPPTCVTANGLRFKEPTATLTPTPLPAEASVKEGDPTADWKTYKLLKFGLQFRLPPIFDTNILNEEEMTGETGNLICATLNKKISLVKSAYAAVAWCDTKSFAIGGTSIDFSAGRGGSFMDMQGYKKDGQKYLAKFVSNQSFEIPNDLIIKEFTSTNGVKLLVVRGANHTIGEYLGPIAGTPGDGWIGAIINNPHNNVYPGVAVQLELSDRLTEELFNQILSTFKFTDEISPAPTSTINTKKLTYFLPSGWKTITDTSGILQAGYDPGKFSATSGNQNIYFNNIQYPVSAMSVSLKPYDGGSRHQFIYNQLGYTAAMAKNEQMDNYHKKEYQYGGWNCLVLYGLGYSSRGTTWGMCAVNPSQAFFIEGGSQEDTEEFISAIKLTK